MLIWTDVETTGLDKQKDHLLEVAVVLTDDALNELDHKTYVLRYKPEELVKIVDEMHVEARLMHTENGLLSVLENSSQCVPRGEVELRLLQMFKKHNVERGKYPLAGSTVSFDRAFFERYFPGVIAYAQYRNLDVSSIKLECSMQAPHVAAARPKSDNPYKRHRALDDVRDSIAELKYYRANHTWRQP